MDCYFRQSWVDKRLSFVGYKVFSIFHILKILILIILISICFVDVPQHPVCTVSDVPCGTPPPPLCASEVCPQQPRRHLHKYVRQ